ncbi:MAG: FhaA domain-containing protein [Roseiflexaceae bacterium]|jgi:hypothetical protein
MPSPIARFEEFMERLLETSIARVLDSRLEESVIMRRLERTMESNQMMHNDKIYVPHNYYAYINPIDYKTLMSKNSQLQQTLTNYLLKLSKTRNFMTISPISAKPVSDSTSDLATIRIAFDPIPLFDLNPRTRSDSTDTFDAVQSEFAGSSLPTSIIKLDSHYIADSTYQITVDNGKETKTHPITQTQLYIGRDKTGNDIVLLDHLVSRNHARINYTNRHFYITDLASSNGTKVNGYLLKKPDFPITVDKDIITLGSYTIQIKRTYRHE